MIWIGHSRAFVQSTSWPDFFDLKLFLVKPGTGGTNQGECDTQAVDALRLGSGKSPKLLTVFLLLYFSRA